MKTIGPVIESESNCDFKYVDKLDIEYIPDLDINVLYIPDELNDKDASILSIPTKVTSGKLRPFEII